jgi:hypothetical protein
MRSPAALLVLAASLVALPAAAEESPLAAPAVPAVVAAPVPYAAPYSVPPPWWALPLPVTERRSKGMMITGTIFFGVGGVVTIIGAGLLAVAESPSCNVEDVHPLPPMGEHGSPRSHGRSGETLGTARQAFMLCGDPSSVNLGLGVLAAGVLGSGVGIPLFVLGNQKGRVQRNPDSAEVPVLHVGAGSAELRWSF